MADSARLLLDPDVLSGLRDLAGPDDPSFVRDLLETWIEDAAGHLAALAESLAAGDAEALFRRAHALKGASASAGCERVRALCLSIELAGRGGDLARAGKLLREVHAAVSETRSAIAALPEVRGA